MTRANVAYVVPWPRLRKTIVMTIAPTAPSTMNGLRTPTRSEMIPMTISAAASNAQNQFPMLLAVDSVKLNREVK